MTPTSLHRSRDRSAGAQLGDSAIAAHGHDTPDDQGPVASLLRFGIIPLLRYRPSWCSIVGGIAGGYVGVADLPPAAISTVEPCALVRLWTASRSSVTACISIDVSWPASRCLIELWALPAVRVSLPLDMEMSVLTERNAIGFRFRNCEALAAALQLMVAAA